MSNDLFTYLYAFSTLRTAHTNAWSEATRFHAPHKPLLLLSVLGLFARGLIHSNFIGLTPELHELFANYCNLIRHNDRPGNMALPFFHLRSSGFWHLIPLVGQEDKLNNLKRVDTLSRLKKIISGAKLDNELFDLLKTDETRESLCTVLLENYFSSKAQVALSTDPYIFKYGLIQKSLRNIRESASTVSDANQLVLLPGFPKVVDIIRAELRDHGKPLHFEVLCKIIYDRHPYLKLNAEKVIKVMNRHPEIFERLDTGVYQTRK